MAINSFNPADLGEQQANEVCEELIRTAEEQFKYRAEVKVHPRMDLLNLYFYMYKKESIDNERNFKSEEISETADAKGLKEKMMSAGDASSSSGVAVKMEHPAWQTVMFEWWEGGRGGETAMLACQYT